MQSCSVNTIATDMTVQCLDQLVINIYVSYTDSASWPPNSYRIQWFSCQNFSFTWSSSSSVYLETHITQKNKSKQKLIHSCKSLLWWWVCSHNFRSMCNTQPFLKFINIEMLTQVKFKKNLFYTEHCSRLVELGTNLPEWLTADSASWARHVAVLSSYQNWLSC